MTPRPKRALKGFAPYEMEPEGGVNLANNASLFPPHPAIERTLRKLDPVLARGYPSLYSELLCEALARLHGVAPEQVVTGNGSSDLIDLTIRAFTDEGARVAYHPPTFSMIPVWAHVNGAEPLAVPLGAGFALDEEAFGAADARVAFLCRPNNPTGNAFPLGQVERLASRFQGLLVVDEAYIAFAGSESAHRLVRYDNVAVLRSLSKDHGLAGVRLGYAVLSQTLADEVRKVRGPFRVSRLTEEIGLAALAEPGWMRETVATVKNERARLAARLAKLGLGPYRSEANFLLVETPWRSADVARALAARGVLVRAFDDERLARCFRTTIGPPEANDALLAALEAIAKDGAP